MSTPEVQTVLRSADDKMKKAAATQMAAIGPSQPRISRCFAFRNKKIRIPAAKKKAMNIPIIVCRLTTV